MIMVIGAIMFSSIGFILFYCASYFQYVMKYNELLNIYGATLKACNNSNSSLQKKEIELNAIRKAGENFNNHTHSKKPYLLYLLFWAIISIISVAMLTHIK